MKLFLTICLGLIFAKAKSGTCYEMNWEDYHDLDTYNAFINALASANDWATVINIGQSQEGRDMNVLAVRKAGPGKPNVWLEAGIHAREWIAPAVATFIIKELVENYAKHPEYLNELNWYLLPIANPDGYKYSWEHEREWRKTRSNNNNKNCLKLRNLVHNQTGCVGVDPNRNWDFHWGEGAKVIGPSVSRCSCDLDYIGPDPFSEIETRNIRNFLMGLKPVPILSHSFHAFGNKWLWPYGYDTNAIPDNEAEMKQLAEDAVKAIKDKHGIDFQAMKSSALYECSGTSTDWYKGVLGSRFSFTTELRGDKETKFHLPKEQIIPSGEEMWEGFKVVIESLINLSKE